MDPGMNQEIIVDLYRMKQKDDKGLMAKSMSRFDDGWENSFEPAYKSQLSKEEDDWEDRYSPPKKKKANDQTTLTPVQYDPNNPLHNDPLAAPWDRIW